jgi:glycosyltransferase involved in cell wall biosynthesis
LLSIRDLVSEIVVVDQASQDGTIEVCEKFNAKIVKMDRDAISRVGFGVLRNIAISTTRTDWVMMIDSDEVVSEQLASDIRVALKSKGPCAGYRVNTIGIAFGKPRRALSGYSAYPRLLRKGFVTFDTHRVHEGFVIRSGVLGQLAGPLLHYTYDSWSDVLRKVNLYSNLHAQELGKDNCAVDQEFISVGKSLFWSLFMQRGLADGIVGLKIALAGARTRMIAYDKARKRWLSKLP